MAFEPHPDLPYWLLKSGLRLGISVAIIGTTRCRELNRSPWYRLGEKSGPFMRYTVSVEGRAAYERWRVSR